jgi:hypothetical protein
MPRFFSSRCNTRAYLLVYLYLILKQERFLASFFRPDSGDPPVGLGLRLPPPSTLAPSAPPLSLRLSTSATGHQVLGAIPSMGQRDGQVDTSAAAGLFLARAWAAATGTSRDTDNPSHRWEQRSRLSFSRSGTGEVEAAFRSFTRRLL